MTSRAAKRVDRATIEAHSGFFAWPTVGLMLLALSLWALNVWSVLNHHIPVWLGALFSIPIAYASFTPFHDATHGAISGGPGIQRADKICGWLAGIPFWAPFSSFVLVHLTHHAHTNDTERDPDYWVFSRNKFSVLLRCLMVYPNYLVHIFHKIPTRGRKVGVIQLQMVAYLSTVALLVVLAFHHGVGFELLGVWVIPGLFTHGLLSFTLDFLPHWPHEDRTRYGQTRIIKGAGLKYLLLGQDMHVVHHLFPSVPFYRYHALGRDIQHVLNEQNVRVEKLY